MRAAIRFSEYKSAGKLPHGDKFDCSVCAGTPSEEKRNCRGEYNTKYRYTIGTTEFSQCPVSVYCFDKEVIKVIDLVMTSLESGIPVTGTCLLDQTDAFFDFKNIIQSEKRDCYEELEKIRAREQKQEQNKAKTANRSPRRRQLR